MWDKPWPKLEMSTYRERTPMLGVFLLPLATERHLPGSFLDRGGGGAFRCLLLFLGCRISCAGWEPLGSTAVMSCPSPAGPFAWRSLQFCDLPPSPAPAESEV